MLHFGYFIAFMHKADLFLSVFFVKKLSFTLHLSQVNQRVPLFLAHNQLTYADFLAVSLSEILAHITC